MKYNRPIRRILQLINLKSDLDNFDNIHERIEKEREQVEKWLSTRLRSKSVKVYFDK